MTSRAYRGAAAVLGTALLLGGCGQTAPPPTLAPAGLSEEALRDRRQLAQKLERSGDLHGALLQWEIVESFGSDSGEAAAERRALQAKIRERVEAEAERASKALEKGKRSEARRRFLKILSLDPDHEAAKEGLRALEADGVRRTRSRLLGTLKKRTPPKAAPDPPVAAPPVKPPVPRAASRNDGEERRDRRTDAAAKAPAASTPKAGREEDEPRQVLAAAPATLPDAPADAPPDAPKKDEPQKDDPGKTASLSKSEALIQKAAYRDSIASLETHLAAYPDDQRAFELLAVAHGRIGLDLHDRGRLRDALPHLRSSSEYALRSGLDRNEPIEAVLLKTKRSLAEESFDKGLRAFAQDVDEAIAFWEESLGYDADFERAQAYLDRARKIKKKLQAVTN